jgi:hypothetical protein
MIQRQRLVRDDVLARPKRGKTYVQVKVIRRGVVDYFHSRIFDQIQIGTVSLSRTEFQRLSLRSLLTRAADRDHIDIAQPSHRIDVMRCDETWTNKAHPNPFRTVRHLDPSFGVWPTTTRAIRTTRAIGACKTERPHMFMQN